MHTNDWLIAESVVDATCKANRSACSTYRAIKPEITISRAIFHLWQVRR